MDKDEDPYLEKYYSLNIDNGKIVGSYTRKAHIHSVTFSHDYAYMLILFSVICRTLLYALLKKGGKVIYKPDLQPDISAVKAVGCNNPKFSLRKGVTEKPIFGA